MKPSLHDLRRVALRNGAELIVDGKPFNAARQQIAVVPPKPAPAPEPEPAPAPVPAQESFTRAEVERLLAAQDQRLEQRFAEIIRQLHAAGKQGPAGPTEWDFAVTYDEHHRITNVNAKATP